MPSVEDTIAGWADSQLAPWRGLPLTGLELAAALGALNAEINHVFVFDFADGDVRIRAKPHYSDVEMQSGGSILVQRARSYRDFFKLVVDICGLRGRFSVGMTMEDYVRRAFAVPVFGFQQRAGANQILVPDIDGVRFNFYADQGPDTVDYDDKRNAAIFVGSTTGEDHSVESVAALTCQRLRSAVFFRDVADVEFRLPHIVQCLTPAAEDAIRALGFGVGRMEWRAQLDYRFLISMDGNGATCSRMALALKSNSVLVKYDSPFELYYFPGLVAGTHYLPVGADREIPDLIEQERQHPGKFRDVAEQGRAFFDRFLSPRPSIAYAGELLRRYFEQFGIDDRVVSPARPVSATGLLATAHVSGQGDMMRNSSSWVGVGGRNLEGFSLLAFHPQMPASIEYRALRHDGDDACWKAAGEFAGSRGRSAPLAGFAVRVCGGGSEQFACCYSGLFSGGQRVGPCWDGVPCMSSAGATLEALRVTVRPR